MLSNESLSARFVQLDRRLKAVLLGVLLGILGGLIGLGVVLFGPVLMMGGVLGVLAGLYILTDLQVALYGVLVRDNKVSWLIDNGTGVPVQLTGIEILDWPMANGRLLSVQLGEEVLREGDLAPGEPLSFREGAKASLAANQAAFLTLVADYAAGKTGYALELDFGGGCRLSGAW